MKSKCSRKGDFPFFKHHSKLAYLDNAATVQKPYVVLEALKSFYEHWNANTGRSTYAIAEVATQKLSEARHVVAQWLNARADEVIFVSSATHGINMLAYAWQEHVGAGKSIVVTQLEHHANYLPWLMLAKRTGAQLRVIPVDKYGQLVLDNLNRYIDETTVIVAVSSMSNVTGLPVSLEPIIARAKAVGAKTVVDACQQAALSPLDVERFCCDALVFSGHKLGGPTGIGVLYLSKQAQTETPPAFFGGGMVDNVTPEVVVAGGFRAYEAGTLPIAQAIGLAAAIEYMNNLDAVRVKEQMNVLLETAVGGLRALDRMSIISGEVLSPQQHLFSFTVRDMHAHDVAAWLNQYGVCVRAGQHCAQPIHKAMSLDATVRVSLFVYNELQDIESFLRAMQSLPRLY